MAANETPQFDNIRDAFCAVYKCRPEAFERKVFWHGVLRHAWLPAKWIWLTERSFFNDDLGMIRTMGDAHSEPELQRAVDDLENLRLVERSIRRGALGIRVSGKRVLTQLLPLVPLLKPQSSHTAALRNPEPAALPAAAAVPVAPAGPRVEGSALTVRRLKRLHADVVAGRDWKLAVADSGLEEGSVGELLKQNSSGRPELAWLQGYLADQRELARLRQENDRLQKAVETLKSAAG